MGMNALLLAFEEEEADVVAFNASCQRLRSLNAKFM